MPEAFFFLIISRHVIRVHPRVISSPKWQINTVYRVVPQPLPELEHTLFTIQLQKLQLVTLLRSSRHLSQESQLLLSHWHHITTSSNVTYNENASPSASLPNSIVIYDENTQPLEMTHLQVLVKFYVHSTPNM